MHTLHTATTWDGEAADPEEVATLTLRRGLDGLHVRIHAPFHGDPAPPGEGSTWGLWEFEVVELFVLGPDDRYVEIELGPHGHYLALVLQGARKVVERERPLDVQVTREGTHWTGEVLIPWSLLPQEPWRGNAYAIHGIGEARRYLVHHPLGTERPDFHAIAAFPELRVD
jgi:hypothetical protein